MTQNGLDVADRIALIWSRSFDGSVQEAATVPSAPTADTEATSSGVVAGPIGACMIGKSHGSRTASPTVSRVLIICRETIKLRTMTADSVTLREFAAELLTSYTTGEGEPWPFYERFGFVPTGERDEAGEIILSLDLSTGVR